jgi:hypothetical protein
MSFSIKWLLFVVAYVGVSLAALLHANELWRVGFRSALLLSVLVTIAGAVWSVGRTRAFCGGYALFALLFFTDLFGSQSEFITASLLTTIHRGAFDSLTETISGPFYPSAYDGDVLTVVHQKNGTLLVTAIRPARLQFLAIGRAVLYFPFAVSGGCVAMWFYSRRQRST